MTLHQLRKWIGDRAFFDLVRKWASGHRYGNVSTAQFVHLAEQVSHQDLTGFFNAWLYTGVKPGLTQK